MYELCFSTCFRCKQSFGFNPHKVSSIRLGDGLKHGMCLDCYNHLNKLRILLGYESWPEPLEGAYDPYSLDEMEAEVDYDND